MGKITNVLHNWLSLSMDATLYKNVFLSEILMLIALCALFGVSVGIGALLTAISQPLGFSVMLILLFISSIVSIFIMQIPIATGLETLYGTSEFWKVIERAKSKLKSMGSAALTYVVIMFALLVIPMVITFVGIITKSVIGVVVGLLLLMIASICVFIVYGLTWIYPMLAYKKNIGVRAVKEAFSLLKKYWVDAFVLVIIFTLIAYAINMVLYIFFYLISILVFAMSLISATAALSAGMISIVIFAVLYGTYLLISATLYASIFTTLLKSSYDEYVNKGVRKRRATHR